MDPNILSAEIRSGHSHQGGHSHASDQKSSEGQTVTGQHDMSGMTDMKAMDHSAMKGIDGTQKPPTSHQHDMKDMPGMAHAATDTDEKATATSIEGLSQLSAADRALAAKQHICPVSGELIGSMGKPIKVTVKDREVWLCCDSCKKKLLESPDQYLSDRLDHNHSK